jgi:hypothetical protein
MRRVILLIALVACGPKHTDGTGNGNGTGSGTGTGTGTVAPEGPDAGPDAPGELPMDEVQTEMEAVRDEIKMNCAATTAFAGVTKVIVTIKPDGSATAEVEASSGMADVDQCVLDSITGSQFSTSQRGQRFHYSFKFK